MFDWNDLRAFLAVARGGSTLAAAKALGVNQTTVARRIEALEAAMGLKLVERGQAGSRPTEAGETLLAEAERVERAVEAFETRAGAYRRGLAGSVRVTCNESVANVIVTPAIPEFRRLYPEVSVEVLITDRILDLAAGEADVAVRGTERLAGDGLVARKLAAFEFALYCSRDYAARRGQPTLETLGAHALVAGADEVAHIPGMQWMLSRAPGAHIACRSNSMTNLVQAVRAGLGVGPIACITGDVDPQLIRCHGPIEGALGHTWLVTREELKDVPRVRAFVDFLAPYATALRRSLEDQAAAVRAGVSPPA